MNHLVMKYWLCLLFLSLTLTACQEDAQVLEKDDASAASLTLTFAVSGEEPGSRGLEDLNDDGTITEAEKNMDGSRMFSLAVFIVDSQNKIVAKKTTLTDGEVSFTQNNTQATVAFTNLNYGENYQLLAIANFGEGAHYQIANNVDATTLLNGTVSTSSSGYICPNGTPYPLTLKKEIVLQPGVNTISGELVRTFARIRITVRNQSSTNDLQIKSLSFPEQFTFHSANLFGTGGNGLSQPVVFHTGAVNAFTGTSDVPYVIAKNEGEVESATIFDAYLLESNGGDYTYTLNVSYGDQDGYQIDNTKVIDQRGDLSSNYSGNQFLIQVYDRNNSYYLYANSDESLEVKTISQDNILALSENELKPYLWTLEQNNSYDYRYYVKSVSTNKYINSNSNSVSLVNKDDYDYFTFSNNGSNGMYMQMYYTTGNYYWKTYYYLYKKGNSISVTSTNNSRSSFIFHPVVSASQSLEHTEEIPITVVDATTGMANSITAINRNDLINILVNVSYSEELGEFNFKVTNWDTGGGDVTFD